MNYARVLFAALLARLTWGPCAFCGRHHDPVDHYPLP